MRVVPVVLEEAAKHLATVDLQACLEVVAEGIESSGALRRAAELGHLCRPVPAEGLAAVLAAPPPGRSCAGPGSVSAP